MTYEQNLKAILDAHLTEIKDSIIDSIIDRILRLKTQAEQKAKWIPVRERMPEDGQIVLFCDIEGDIMIGYHINGRPYTHFSQCGTFDDIKNVIAWMPLPEPYDAESEE